MLLEVQDPCSGFLIACALVLGVWNIWGSSLYITVGLSEARQSAHCVWGAREGPQVHILELAYHQVHLESRKPLSFCMCGGEVNVFLKEKFEVRSGQELPSICWWYGWSLQSITGAGLPFWPDARGGKMILEQWRTEWLLCNKMSHQLNCWPAFGRRINEPIVSYSFNSKRKCVLVGKWSTKKKNQKTKNKKPMEILLINFELLEAIEGSRSLPDFIAGFLLCEMIDFFLPTF